MRTSELVGVPVVTADGRRLGYVTGLLCTLDGGGRGPVQAPRLRALVVGPRLLGGSLGYQQDGQRGPAVMRWFFRRLHRETHVVEWAEVREIRDGTIRLTRSGD
jgi:hypothetical protein